MVVVPDVKEGVPTVGVIVTVCIAVLGPLQPVAMVVIALVPLHVAAYVTIPVLETILLPPDIEGPSKLYVIPVLLVAVAVKVTVPAPWQRVVVVPDVKTGVSTVGVTVIVAVPVIGFEHAGVA